MFQTGAKIYLSEKNILRLGALLSGFEQPSTEAPL